jgi:hypothetical protein
MVVFPDNLLKPEQLLGAALKQARICKEGRKKKEE